MKCKICSRCSSKMQRNGHTSSGKQKWICHKCGSSCVSKNDVEVREFKQFLRWLFSKEVQQDMVGCGRTLRRHNEKFWEYIPVPSYVDEIHKVVYIDGVDVAGIRMLIAVSDGYVLSWHLARSENSYDWSILLKNIAPPEMVVCDGAGGIKKAIEDI